MIAANDIARFLGGEGAGPLADFLSRQRWFAAKARGIRQVRVEDWAVLRSSPPILLLLVNVDGDRYYVPISVTSYEPEHTARIITRLDGQTLSDAHWEPDFGRALVASIASGGTLGGAVGSFRFQPMSPWGGPGPDALRDMRIQPLEGEQSNTSLRFDRALILKSFRRPQTGINPEFEITHALTGRTSFRHAPRLAGWIDYADRDSQTATVAVLQVFVENAGDGWQYTLAALHRACDAIQHEADRTPAAFARPLVEEIHALGRVTGGLHAALASETSLPDFRPEPITEEDTARWSDDIARDAERLCTELAAARGRLPAAAQPALSVLEQSREQIAVVARDLGLLVDGRISKIRCHGDYHLGQVLKTHDAFLVIDFEGEPARSLAERRRKHAVLRDVAGMLRSLNYAVHAVARARAAEDLRSCLEPLERWEVMARRAFIDGYLTEVSTSVTPLIPSDPAACARACAVFELEKACYEVRYELNNRPDWIAIPLAGMSRILEARTPAG